MFVPDVVKFLRYCVYKNWVAKRSGRRKNNPKTYCLQPWLLLVQKCMTPVSYVYIAMYSMENIDPTYYQAPSYSSTVVSNGPPLIYHWATGTGQRLLVMKVNRGARAWMNVKRQTEQRWWMWECDSVPALSVDPKLKQMLLGVEVSCIDCTDWYGILSGATQTSIGMDDRSSCHEAQCPRNVFTNISIDLFCLSLSIFPLSISHISGPFYVYNVKFVQSLSVKKCILTLIKRSSGLQSCCFMKWLWMWNLLVDRKGQVVTELLLWIVNANRAH